MSPRTTTLPVVAAAAFAAFGAAFAQPSLELFSIDREQQLLERIVDFQADGGVRPPNTIEPLRALALLYQEAGDHAPAIATLEEARHRTRVHHGLSSVDEALLLRHLLRSERARGNHVRVWNLKQDMVTIARLHLDDIRTAPIFRELADEGVDVLNRYFGGEIPPDIQLGCYYAAGLPRYDDTRGERRPVGEGSCQSGGKSGAMLGLRRETLLYYADAIEVIVRNGDYASEELRDLERQALRVGFNASYPWLPTYGNAVTDDAQHRRSGGRCLSSTFDELLAVELLDSCLDPVIHADGVVYANVGSWVSLVRLLSYEIRSGAPVATRAKALAELADWLLLSTPAGRRRFDRNGEMALELYGRVHRQLEQDADLEASARQMLRPEVPVTLPTFVPNPFASAATAKSSRYIDVAFTVTSYGRGERVEILGRSDDVTRAEEKEVINLILGATFRPRMVEGDLAAADPVVVRYHLTSRSLQEAREMGLTLCEHARVCRP